MSHRLLPSLSLIPRQRSPGDIKDPKSVNFSQECLQSMHPPLKTPQLWPHNHLDPHSVSHMQKFQDISWDQLVAGKVAIILQAKSCTQAMGRLQLLKQLAYWKLCSGNLYKVQQLYMAVVRAIEEGESSLSSNFQLLEVLVMGDQTKAAHKP